jgi:hypothetical protein
MALQEKALWNWLAERRDKVISKSWRLDGLSGGKENYRRI